MATDYPNGIDAFNNPTATDYLDSATVPHADQHANANDAIEAIETELGTNPKGSKADVATRLDDVDTEISDLGNTSISTSLPLTSSGTVGGDDLTIGINSASANTASYVVQRDADGGFTTGSITFDPNAPQVSAAGKLYFDGNGSLALGLLGGNVTVGINEDIVCYVTNAEATTLNIGEVVYLYGAQGDRPTVKRAYNTSDATSAKTFGFVAESIAAGQTGFVTIRGTVRKVDTSAYTAGDALYLGSTPGTFTNVKPSAPNHLVYLGVVERSNSGNGQIQVVVQNGWELEELHNVAITSAANGQTIFYNSTTGLWENKSFSATAPITYDASTRTIAANSATTTQQGVVSLTDSTSSTSTTTAATPNSVKSAYDLANAAIPATQKGAANGVATLDSNGLVPSNQLPAIAITSTYVVNSQAAMLALTAEEGDVAIRTDVSKSYILTATPASTLGNWQELLSPPDAVTSVDGRTGTVTLSDLYASKSISISTTSPLTGGGDLSASRTLAINSATTTQAGAVSLTDSTSSTSTTTAATPNSVKSAYDLANAAVPKSTLTTKGDILTYTTGVARLGVGTNGQMLVAASGQTTGLLWTNSVNNIDVTSSTIPANGIYLPSANTLGLATNSAVALQINSTGDIGIGVSPTVARGIVFQKSVTGSASARGFNMVPTLQSDVTTDYFGFQTSVNTAAASFTLNTLQHFRAVQGTFGVGSTINSQTGFWADSTLIGATANYGFYGNLAASGSARWNFYANGTAANYFAGQTTVGSTSLTLGASSVAQQFGVVSSAATNIAAVIRGAASQTGDLTQWQSSAAAVLAKVDSAGNLYAPTLQSTTASKATLTTNGDTGGLLVSTGADANKGIVTKANSATQSADLIQLQNSAGTVLDAFDATGLQRSQAQLIQYGAEGSILQNLPTRIHPGEALLKQSVYWIDSVHSSATGQTLTNLGWTGDLLPTTLGSSTSADSNDPQYLAWNGTNYVYLPGVVSNYMSVPDANDLDITGDIDIRVQVAMDDWTPSADMVLLSKMQTTSTYSYMLYLETTGKIYMFWSENGTVNKNAVSSVATGITDGTVKWIRATLDVDNGASGNTVTFYTSDDGITWTQLGSTVVTAGITSIFSSTSEIEIGTWRLTQNPLAGKIYRAQIFNGINGTKVLDVDTSVISSGAATSFTALSGQTVTINRSTSGRKSVAVVHPCWLFGTDDYMEVNNRYMSSGTYLYLPGVASNYASAPDSAALDITGDIDIRVKVALDDWTPSTDTGLISKWVGGSGQNSYDLSVQATTGLLVFQWTADGSTTISKTSTITNGITDGATKWIRATLTVNNGASGNDVKFYTSDDGSSWTQLGSTVTTAGTTSIYSGTNNLGIGCRPNGTSLIARGKFFRAQVLNGIGGTVAFDANFETSITSLTQASFTEGSANAATVTINYSGTGYRSAGITAAGYVYPGNPNTFRASAVDYLNFGATDDFTILAILRQWTTPPSFRQYLSKGRSGENAAYKLAANGTNAGIYAQIVDVSNNSQAQSQSFTFGSTVASATVINRTAQTLLPYVNGTAGTSVSTSAVGSLVTSGTLKVGANTDLGGYSDIEFVAAAIFRRALSATEIAQISNYFAGRVGA